MASWPRLRSIGDSTRWRRWTASSADRRLRDRRRTQGAHQGRDQRIDRAGEDVFGRRSRPLRERRPRSSGRHRDLSGTPGLDDLLAELEKTIGKLADGTAPLEELVAAHERALRLLADAQARFAEMKARADQTAKLLTS